MANGTRGRIFISRNTGAQYIGIRFQQATSFAYTSSHSVPVSVLTVQPILSYQLGHDWYVKSSDATWTINWRHNTSTTMPLSAGLGKVWKLSDGASVDTSYSGGVGWPIGNSRLRPNNSRLTFSLPGCSPSSNSERLAGVPRDAPKKVQLR